MDKSKEVSTFAIFSQLDDSTQVLATTCGNDVKIWDVLSGQLLYLLHGHLQTVSALSSCHYETEEEEKTNHNECKVYFVTGSDDGEARLWRPSLEKTSNAAIDIASISIFPKLHSGGISAITLHPNVHRDHEHVAVLASKDKTASVWQIKDNNNDGSVEISFMVHLKASHTDLINSVAAYRDDQCADHELVVITASTDKSLRYWKISTDRKYNAEDTETPILVKSNAHVKAITCIASYTLTTKEATIDFEKQEDNSFQRRETVRENYYANVLVSGSLDKSVAVRSLQKPDNLIITMKGHDDKVNGVRVVDSRMKGSPPMIVSCSDDCSVIIWNLLDGKILRRMRYSHKLTSITVFNTPEGFMIACTATNGRVAIWNYVHIERIRRFETAAVTAIDICYPRSGTNEKTLMVVGTIDSTCHVLDYFGNKQAESRRYLKGHTNRINAALVYSPPDPAEVPLVVTCSNDGTVRVFNLWTGRMKKVWRVDPVLTYGLAIYNPQLCGWAAEESAVGSVGSSAGVCYLDMNQPWIVAGGLHGMLTVLDLIDAAKAPDFLEDVVIVESTDYAVNIQAHKKFNIVRTIAIHHDRVYKNQSKVISGGYDHLTIIWDLCTMTQLRKLEGHIDKVFAVAVYDPFVCYDDAASLPENNQQQLIVTGSYDKTTIVWEMNSGAQRHTLLGHGESVTDMVIYSVKESPLLATGSIDKIIIVWNLLTGERLQTLVGHTDRICFLTLYMPPVPSFCDFPTIVSGGDDRAVIIWEDAFHSQVNSFSRDNVNRAFHYDLEEEDWPLLTRLLGEGPNVLLENPQLFYFAIEHDRPDFILKFRSVLRESLPFLDKHRVQIIQEDLDNTVSHEEPKEMDILSYAIAFEDLVSVRAILLSWTEIMNKDISNTLGQSLYYPGYFFPVEALEPLAKVYPLEYMHFLCAIKLVRNHSSVMSDCFSALGNASNQPKKQKDMHTVAKTFVLSEWDRYEIYGTNMRNDGFTNTWSSYLQDRRSISRWGRILELFFIPYRNSPQPVTSLMLPLRRTSNIHKSLATYVKVSAQLNRWDIFRSDVGDYTLKYCWTHGGKEAHFRALIHYSVVFVLFMISVYSYHEINEESTVDARLSSCYFALLTILGFFTLILTEFIQYLVRFSDIIHVKNTTTKAKKKKMHGKTTDKNAPLKVERSTSMKRRASKTAAAAVSDKSLQQARVLYKTSSHHGGSTQQSLQQQEKKKEGVKSIVAAGKSTLFSLNLNLDRDEELQANFSTENLIFYFTHDLWNVLDCSICIFGILGMLLRLVYNFQDTPTGRCFLAMTSILMWFKWLYFLRPYPWSGPLVVMIVTIAYSIRSFMFVLFLVLAGFAQAFWLLSTVDASLPFGQVTSAFYNAFLFMLGQDVEVTFDESVSSRFATFVLSMFLITMGILMLNLLIALMGDTFADVRSQGVAFFRNEQAQIILEEQAWAKAKELPAYLHVLKYSTDVVLLNGGHGGDDQLTVEENNQLIPLVRGSVNLVKSFTPYNE